MVLNIVGLEFEVYSFQAQCYLVKSTRMFCTLDFSDCNLVRYWTPHLMMKIKLANPREIFTQSLVTPKKLLRVKRLKSITSKLTRNLIIIR